KVLISPRLRSLNVLTLSDTHVDNSLTTLLPLSPSLFERPAVTKNCVGRITVRRLNITQRITQLDRRLVRTIERNTLSLSRFLELVDRRQRFIVRVTHRQGSTGHSIQRVRCRIQS